MHRVMVMVRNRIMARVSISISFSVTRRVMVI